MPQVHTSPADRNLLFGILALQMDFIDREALVKAMSAWVCDKAKPLGHIFRDQGSLNQDELAMLDALVAKHLQKHGNDPEKSLAAVNAAAASLDGLHQLADADLDASLVRASENHPTCADPFATQAVASTGSPSPTARYRILRPHAKGGLGQVSVALDEELHREVALKEIQNQHADNLENRARFLVEAEITGRLEHPGIVPVYGLGQYADGRPYYAMRFIRGDNLKEAVKRFHDAKGPQRDPGERAIEFRQLLGRFLDVCNAMSFAHSRGVLHRDLKPGNIMLGQYGETLVVDWGLAKLMSEKEPPSQVKGQPLALASGSGSAETIAGSALGTPQFMSPEQAEGRLDLLGPASDVYSLGATLYYLLTGKSPFEDPDVGTVLRKVAAGDFPRPRQVKPGVPAPLEAVCLKAMSLKLKDRYRSARALADDLEHWLADEPVSAWKEPAIARAMRWARRHRTVVAATGALLMAAVTALAISTVLISREQAHTEVERKKAQSNFEMANKLAEENRRRLVGIYVNNGVRQMDDGKMELAVIWFAEALKLDADHPEKVAVHRLRLAAALQRCSKVVQMLWHDGAVSYAEFSRDGQRAITASEDNTAQVWDVNTGQPLGPKLKHHDTVRHASFSPDGKSVVTTSNDQTAIVWDAVTGQPLYPPLKHEALVRRAAYSPDGASLVTVSQDKTARIWNAQTGTPLAKLVHGGFVYFAAFSADGRRVVTACADNDKTVRVWNTATGEPLTLLKNRDYVLSAAFSPDGAQIVTGAKNGAVLITKISGTGDEIGPATDEKTLWYGGPVDRVSFTADGLRVLAVGSGGAQLVETATGRRLFPASAYWDNNPAFSPDGRYELFWSSNDPSARIRDQATGRPQSVALGNLDWATLQRDGTRLVTVGAGQLARIWDAGTGKPLSPPLEASNAVIRAWLSANGQQVLGYDKFTARIWDARTGKPMSPPMQHGSPIRFAAFSADGRRIVTASDDNSVRTWDTATGGVLGVFLDHKDLIEHAAFSPDGSIVISSGRDNVARAWDAVTGKALAAPPLRHPSWVRYAAFSSDGKRVVTVSSKLAKVWEAATGKTLAEFKHTGRVAEAAFSLDGGRLLTVSDDTDDRTVRIWNVVSGEAVTPPLEHKEMLKHAWFSPDGLRVLSATDRDARLWDATTGEPITPRLEHPHLLDAAFAPDGFGVITVGKDGTVHSWDLPRDDRPIEDLMRLAELVSGLRHDAVRGCEPCPPALLRESWGRLRAKYPDDFQCARQTVAAWHRQEAADAEQTGHWKEAVLHLDALVKHEPAQAALHVRRGKAFVELGERKKAIDDFTAALKLNPDGIAAAITLANLMMLEGKQQEVEDIFRPILVAQEAMVQANPLIGAYRKDLAWALENLALLRQLGGRLADAEAVCQRALALREKLAQEHSKESLDRLSLAICHEKLGSILRQAKKPEEAEKAYRASQAIRENLLAEFPTAEFHDGLAWFLAVCPDERLRDPAKAVAEASKAVALAPEAGNYWTTLGVAQYRAGAWQDARASLDKSVALNAGGKSINGLFLAMTHQKLGDKVQARRWYDQAAAPMDKKAVTAEQRAFRGEAAAVLGLAPIP